MTGAVDLLLTQFSFAAWKGGKENKRWRKDAAQQKLETMKLQLEVFNPKIVVSFASFIYFSNKTNSYLNDRPIPRDVVEFLHKSENKIVVLKPLETLEQALKQNDNRVSCDFWENIYNGIGRRSYSTFKSVPFSAKLSYLLTNTAIVFLRRTIWAL